MGGYASFDSAFGMITPGIGSELPVGRCVDTTVW